MTGLIYTILVHLPGTLAANQQGVIRIPLQGATLVEVAATGSNANDAKLTIGTAADADGILVAGAIGDSSDPAVFTPRTFNGALADPLDISCPHLAKDTVLVWSLDFDGAGGTAAADVDIQFNFLEG